VVIPEDGVSALDPFDLAAALRQVTALHGRVGSSSASARGDRRHPRESAAIDGDTAE
jgi:hypothetical protein